jgi:hypothetical protein
VKPFYSLLVLLIRTLNSVFALDLAVTGFVPWDLEMSAM